VVAPSAQPMVSVVGRIVFVGVGPQDSTTGNEAAFVVVVDVKGLVTVVVDPPLVLDPPLSVWVAGGDEVELTVSPMAVPIPRATRTSATTPNRTRVVRRIVTTLVSRLARRATEDKGSSADSPPDTQGQRSHGSPYIGGGTSSSWRTVVGRT
jgi:hypothetical protein